MGAGKKRIGLLLASVHSGVSKKSWKDFARVAAMENASLFVFPGGRLGAGKNHENLRNHVYRLANPGNLDGCISWSSTIRYGQSKEEFQKFHAGLDPLPYVTVAFKSPGHPCVDFDAYKGMKALVTHCVRQHGAKKIAFLRGPDFHQSARMRFEGYRDALVEAGIISARDARDENPSPLVTDPFDWESGYSAAEQLLRGRSLVPGRDFDTLVGSSDMMTLDATDYFAGHGFHVPGDYRATGFNNSEESRVAECPLTTVQHPDAKMAEETVGILLGMLDGGEPGGDVLLETEVIIRDSCGCSGLYGFLHQIPGLPVPGGDERETLKKLADRHLRPYSRVMDTVTVPVIEALVGNGPDSFFPVFERALAAFFGRDGDAENLLRLVDDIRMGGYGLSGRYRNMEAGAYRSILKVREQFSARAAFEKDRWNRVLSSLKSDLLEAGDRFSLVQTLAWHLPRMGIDTAAVVLYESEKTSVFVGGFCPEGTSPVRGQRFPAGLIVPESFGGCLGDGVFMVQPLFIENRSLGYLVHRVSSGDGVVFEELRFSVSYGLRGVLLAEETTRVRRVAERTERAKAEFLHVLEDGLHASVSPAEAMDFVMARTDGIPLGKTVFDIEELLPGIGSFPLLSGDPSRLAQCFSLIRERYPGLPVSAEMGHGGLSVTFRGSPSPGEGAGRAEKVRQFSLLLAERVVLMHGGDLSVHEDRCTVLLPWTTLTGGEPTGNAVSPGQQVLVLSGPDSLPHGFFDLPQVYDADAVRPGGVAFVAWNAVAAGTGDLVRIAGLRNRDEFAGVPFLCYGTPAGAREANDNAAGRAPAVSTLMDMVELALSPLKKGNILFVGSREYWAEKIDLFAPAGDENRPGRIRIDSMSAFNETVGEVSPLLVVFEGIDAKAAAAVRRHPLTVTVPVIMVGDKVDSQADVLALGRYPRLIICHRAVISSPDFRKRVWDLAEGGEILPQHTGVLVKKAILYFDQNAGSYISRWKLADTVNVSEDYLSRIFHREMGLPLWDYLNRLRIFLAAELLLSTDDSIQAIALRTGFQDQSYFCRIFKKMYGVPPGQFRRN
ncbi:MAG: helix-turn-helix domain-containing protein [Treponema sp.]|nr:helix-turn-helix domain-containing protein [Treponema sp.]